MAIDYLSYQQSVQSPLERALAGFQSGLAIRQNREQMSALEAKQAQARAMQDDLAAFSQLENPSAQDYASIMTRYPDLADHFKKSFDVLESGRQQTAQKQALDLFSALDSGQTDIALASLEDQKLAAEKEGDPNKIRAADAMIQLVKTNPAAAKSSAGLMLSASMGPERFGDVFTKLQDERRKQQMAPLEINKARADLGLTNAQTKQALAGVEKTNVETQKAILELEAAKQGKSVFDPEKQFKAERELRAEYATQTKNFTDVQEAFRRINAAEDTAAGDLSLIFSYMKMLDPGSVVREGEFATAQNAAGVPERVLNIYNNLLSGERLNPGQRKSFKSQANGLYDASRKREQEVRKGLERVVKDYGLNQDNVFLTEPPSDSTKETTQEELRGNDLLSAADKILGM